MFDVFFRVSFKEMPQRSSEFIVLAGGTKMEVVSESSGSASKGPEVTSEDVISKTLLYIIKGTTSSQPRLIQRALRQNCSIRKYITSKQVCGVSKFVFLHLLLLSKILGYFKCEWNIH